MLWGRLSNRDAHKNISFSVPEPAYHETGILLNRILRYKYMEFAYLNFNAGYFTRVTDQFNVKETEFSDVRFKGDATKAKATYAGYTPLSAADIADTIYYCATLPHHVCINDLEITCLAQASAVNFHKA
jgi:hypothetical protein